MKNLKYTLIGLLASVVLALTSSVVSAAGTVTISNDNVPGQYVWVCTYSFTADSADGSVPTKNCQVDGFVFMVVTNPGSTAPTDNYDITLTDSDGIDIFAGLLADRDTSTSEEVSLEIPRYVYGNLTMTITNNSVNSAVGDVKVYYIR